MSTVLLTTVRRACRLPPSDLEAIAWKYRTCSPWRDLSSELGSFKTAHKRWIRWTVEGAWGRILAAVLAVDAGGRGGLDGVGGLHCLPSR